MRPRISLITLGVQDLARACQFYEAGLGLPRLALDSDEVAFFRLNGTWLGLYSREALAQDAGLSDEGGGFRGVSLSHNVASREEVDQVMEQAQAAGATLTKAAQDTFWGGYAGYFSDPDGHLWEIAWNPHMWIGPEDEPEE